MRSVVAIALLLFMLLQAAGYLFVFAIQMRQNSEWQQRVERLLNLFDLLFLSPHDEASWVDAVEEMALNNYCFGLKIWIDTPPTPPPEA